jgi:Carboxypeptidase regulatory-like domain
MTMNSSRIAPCKKALGGLSRWAFFGPQRMVWLGLSVLLFALPGFAQSQPPPSVPGAGSSRPDATATATSVDPDLPERQLPGSMSGIIVDETGAAIVGSQVKLTRGDQSKFQEVVSGDDGQFSFDNIAPGPFQLTVASVGFTTQTIAGTLHSGEIFVVPQIKLAIAPNVTVVRVGLTKTEAAEVQIKAEEKQRVLGFMPNFYVNYDPDPVPLNSKQKFELAWKTTVNPASFGIVGAIAGVQQADNSFSGYGQGAQGYAKRYGAAYADFVSGTFIGAAILPSVLKQDPRYFYKGTGSKPSRILYAMANAVICKGDNGHWQANYSNILGSLASGGISNLYYPSTDRGAELTFENAGIGIGATAVANVLQEFIVRKLTPHLAERDPTNP